MALILKGWNFNYPKALRWTSFSLLLNPSMMEDVGIRPRLFYARGIRGNDFLAIQPLLPLTR